MPRKSPAQLQDPNIVERHAAPIGEVVLMTYRERGFFEIQFIRPAAEGQFVRKCIGIHKGTRNAVARRMMDIHAGLCAAQHDLGKALAA